MSTGPRYEHTLVPQLGVLLSGPSRPARVELEEVDSSPDGHTSRILFRSADEPVGDGNLRIPLGHSLDFIQSLRVPNLTAAQGLLYWGGRTTTGRVGLGGRTAGLGGRTARMGGRTAGLGGRHSAKCSALALSISAER